MLDYIDIFDVKIIMGEKYTRLDEEALV